MLDISLPVMARKPIALVGGSCSGKSAVLKLLAQHSRIGPKITIIPEVYTDLVTRGVIKQSSDVEEVRHNQILAVKVLLQTERERASEAAVQGRTLVCDRGLPDTAVFLPGGVSEFEKLLGHTVAEALDRYGLVIELGRPPEDVYNAIHASNPVRTRPYGAVCEGEQAFTDIYSKHSNYTYVPYSANWDEKAAAVIKIVEDYLK